VRTDTVTREEVAIVRTSEPGSPTTIGEAARAAFARLESAIPPRGRRAYGYWDPGASLYHACYELLDADRPEELGFTRAVLAGGMYRRGRLEGEDVYAQIGPAFDELAAGAEIDRTRPWFELYRRHDEVDVFVPVMS
jgi:hypothetical protein